MQSVSKCAYQKRLHEDVIVCCGSEVLNPFMYKVEVHVSGVGRLRPLSPHDFPLWSRSPYPQNQGLGSDNC